MLYLEKYFTPEKEIILPKVKQEKKYQLLIVAPNLLKIQLASNIERIHS